MTLNSEVPKNEISFPQLNTTESTFVLCFLLTLSVPKVGKKTVSSNSFSMFNVEKVLFT